MSRNGRLVFHIFASLAEFIASSSWMAHTKAWPRQRGDQVRSARTLLAERDHSVTSIAKLLGVSRSTIYKYLLELSGRSRVELLGWGICLGHRDPFRRG